MFHDILSYTICQQIQKCIVVRRPARQNDNSKGVKMKNLKKKVDNCFSKVLECTYTEWWLINSSCFAFYNISSVYGLIKYFCPGGSRQSGSLVPTVVSF